MGGGSYCFDSHAHVLPQAYQLNHVCHALACSAVLQQSRVATLPHRPCPSPWYALLIQLWRPFVVIRISVESPFHLATLQSLLQLLGCVAVDKRLHQQEQHQQSRPPLLPEECDPQPGQDSGRTSSSTSAAGQDPEQLQPLYQGKNARSIPQELLLRLQAFCQAGEIRHTASTSGHSSCRSAATGAEDGTYCANGTVASSQCGSVSNPSRSSSQEFAEMSAQQINSLTAERIRSHDTEVLERGLAFSAELGHDLLNSSSPLHMPHNGLASVQFLQLSFQALREKHMAQVAR
jgi:hypothetical protein